MSTTTADKYRIDTSGTSKVPFGRLVAVEWRKMLDTRAGFWLIAVTALLLVLVMGITLLVGALSADPPNIGASTYAEILTIVLSLLIPLFAILTVTQEWSQRTNLVTFTLEPHRVKVMAAKLVAVLLLAILTVVIAIALGALGNILYGAISGNDPVWDLEFGELMKLLLQQALPFLMAFGLAMLLRNTPGAIAIFYVFGLMLPIMVYSTLMNVPATADWARDLIPFFDLTSGIMPVLGDGETMYGTIDVEAMDWLRAGSSVLIWVIIPIVLGAWRVAKTEIK